MKIIDKGNPWWLGKIVECPKCGCRVELELKDRPTLEPDFLECGEIIQCPTCINVISVPGNPEWEKRQEDHKAYEKIASEVRAYDVNDLK